MERIKNRIIATIAVATLVGSFVLAGVLAGHAAPPPPVADVTVVNTTANPVPTQAVGTTSVSVSNQPTVKIGNNALTPVAVRDVDNPARHPFQFMGTMSKNDGNSQSVSQITVPAGKQLVIETVTVQVFVPAGQKVLAKIGMVGGGNFAEHKLMLTPQGSFNFDLEDYFAATESVRLYADQGSAIAVNLTRSGSDVNLWGGSYTVSGYLLDIQ